MTRSLKDGEVNELKLNADIYNIVSSYVNLKKSGKNFTGLCPFHKEKTPSFIVDSQTQLYHCFGCGAGGDVISFIMNIENLSFLEAVELLAKKVGYELKYIESSYGKETDGKSKLFELNELAKKYFNYILFNSKNGVRALDYLKSRKISSETLQFFEAGYSINSWNNFTDFAKTRKFNETDIIQSGLGIESQKKNKKNKAYDRFRGRLMFPIKDLLGRTIGFGGRVLPKKLNYVSTNNDAAIENNLKNKKTFNKKGTVNMGIDQAKYINTPETRLYSKSKNIYGIFEAKKHIVEKDYVLIVEGYMDAISLFDNGIKNTVASLGTALTSDQIKILGRFTKNIVLVFDADEAGVNASIKGMDRLKEYNSNLDLFNENNISMKVCILDEGFDPADFITRKGANAFLEKVGNSVNIIDFTLEMILSKYNLNEMTGKLRASDELLQFISSLSSSIIQEECIKKIAIKLKLKESMLIEEMLKKAVKKKNGLFAKDDEDTKSKDSYSQFLAKNINPQKKLEIEALSLIIGGADYPEMKIINLPLEYFKFEDTRKLMAMVKEFIDEQSMSKNAINFPLQISSDKFENENIQRLYNYIYFSGKNYIDKKESCFEVFLNLKRLSISEKIEKLKIKVSEIERKIKENKNTDADKSQNILEKEYDLSYKELIRLENEKLKLGKCD
ncbi:MAG: CHC2 zinc finger domain-containing protein [Actinomycetota bacterium]|nr:CHC2 zinc finger domain-containing protein [Actinomycetota bacterium]